jgi:hypothetical protein
MRGVVLHLDTATMRCLMWQHWGAACAVVGACACEKAGSRIMVSLELHVLTWGKAIDGKNHPEPEIEPNLDQQTTHP